MRNSQNQLKSQPFIDDDNVCITQIDYRHLNFIIDSVTFKLEKNLKTLLIWIILTTVMATLANALF